MKPPREEIVHVLLIDDHPLVREGIRAALSDEKEVKVVAEAATGKQAVNMVRKKSPDVVVLNINLPDLNGLEVCRMLTNEAPSLKILVLTSHANREYVLRVLGSGAMGYLLKEAAPGELRRAICAVFEGHAYFSPPIAKALRSELLRRVRRGGEVSRGPLTPRESEVLDLLAHGFSSKEIAGVLNLSPRTVETHRQRIKQKLNIKSGAALIRYAIENETAA